LTDWGGLRRGTLLYAWILSIGILVAARLWASVWSNVVRSEIRKDRRAESEKPRNVLLIGGAGYIGSALLPKLLNKGYNVRLFDLFLFGTEPIEEVLDHPRLEIMKADFRQVDRVVEAMRDIDAVIHLGAIVGDPACALDEDLTIEVNLMATRMIAEVAKGCGVSRFIFASTCSVYGASDEILDEHSVLNPVSLYARSKIASEQVLMSMSDAGFAPTLLRFGTIYGLSGRTRFDLVVNLLTAKARIDGEITVMGGDQWRPFVHVHDAALAVLKTLEAPLPQVRNQIYNVGSNEQNYTISDVGRIINNMVSSARLIDLGSDTDRRNYRVNFNKIRDSLGFAPEWTVEQGVQQVIEAIESGKVKDYRDPKFSNVKFLGDEGADRLAPQNGWAHELIKESSVKRPPLRLAAAGD
ncbi:MAG TPA: SDR family oxidoreductase, partial [Blastocatellia bacterium]